MKDLNSFECLNVSGGVKDNTTHVEVTAINAGYVHVTVDVYQQPIQVPTIINHNNVYVYK